MDIIKTLYHWIEKAGREHETSGPYGDFISVITKEPFMTTFTAYYEDTEHVATEWSRDADDEMVDSYRTILLPLTRILSDISYEDSEIHKVSAEIHRQEGKPEEASSDSVDANIYYQVHAWADYLIEWME